MSTVSHQSVSASKRNRSAITNSSWLLSGVDNRKGLGRRYRDLCVGFADDLGGREKLNSQQEAMIRQAAGVTLEVEKLQAAIVTGEAIDHEMLVRLSNLQSRLIKQLGIKPGGKDSDVDVDDYLKQRNQAA